MIKRSPVYWEKMMGMDAGTLRKAFSDCARLDLAWAVDQARCLSMNVRADSAQAKITRQFCATAADRALQEGDVATAVDALQIYGDDPAMSEDAAIAAAARLRASLDRMLKDNRDHALGVAVLVKARTLKNSHLVHQALDFLLTEAGDDSYGILMNVVRAGGDKLTEAIMEKLIGRAEKLAATSPYQAYAIAREIISLDCPMTNRQGQRLVAMKDALGGRTDVQLDILEHEYGEDTEGLRRLERANPAQIMPVIPSVLH